MMEIIERAFAKLNLTLDVLSRLDDGYHSMRMVMQSAALFDDISISITDEPSFTASSNLSYLPADEKNLAAMAARVFFEETGQSGRGARISIKKRIPVCAGLGGGSSDAAAVLRGLNRLTGTRLGEKELCSLGFKLGADVPFCISGGTALAEGKGEILSDLPPLPSCTVVICKPGFSISTPKLFDKIDCDKLRNRPDSDGMIHALELGDLRGVAMRMYNVFEDVLPRTAWEIAQIKRSLLDHGALGVCMSGTGPTVFGLFAGSKTAAFAANQLRKDYSACFIAETMKKLII